MSQRKCEKTKSDPHVFTYAIKVEEEQSKLVNDEIYIECFEEDWKEMIGENNNIVGMCSLSNGNNTDIVDLGTDHGVESMAFEELIKPSVSCCKLCPKRFKNRYFTLKHNLKHAQIHLALPTMYQCDDCNGIFTRKCRIVMHINDKHTTISKRIVKCKYCNKKFKYKHWHEHVKNVHNNKLFKCTICDKKFKCERNLKRHDLYLHKKLRPNWMVKRANERDGSEYWQCPYCTKVFKSRDCVNHHVNNVHSGSNGYKCNICSSVLKAEPYLKAHMRRVHYDDGKVHRCDLCGKTFKSPRYVRVHKKNSHNAKHGTKNSAKPRKIKERIVFED